MQLLPTTANNRRRDTVYLEHYQHSRRNLYVIVTMGALNLIPLVILFLVVGGVGWVGYQVRHARSACAYSPQQLHTPPTCSPHTAKRISLTPCAQIYLYSNELAERGVRKMEKKNVVFTKDGAKVGVKEVSAEQYADKTQRAFVKTWNAAQESPQTGHTVRTRRA